MNIRLFALSLSTILLAAVACTKSTPDSSDTSIIGGRLADYHPFMVMISDDSEKPYPYCGGSWIAEGVVVTAAHCLRGKTNPAKVTVTAMKEREDTEFNSVKVRAVVIHPDYNPQQNQAKHNDIALLFVDRLNHDNLERPVTPIALNTIHDLPETLGKVTTIGTGNESNYGFLFTGDLRQVEVPVVGTEECKKANGYERVWEHEICAGDLEAGSIDACQGDSGGPLIAMNDGRPVLVGIVSWGIACANRGRPGVYTRVSSFTNWIYEQIGRYNTAAGENAADIAAAVTQHCYTGFAHQSKPYPDYEKQFNVSSNFTLDLAFERHTNIPAVVDPKSTCSFNRPGLGNVRADVEVEDGVAKMHVVLESGNTWIAELKHAQAVLADCHADKQFVIEIEENNSWLKVDDVWYRVLDEVRAPDFTGFETSECRIKGTSVLFGTKTNDDQSPVFMATLESTEGNHPAKTYNLSKASGSSTPHHGISLKADFAGSKTAASFEIKNQTGDDIYTWSFVCPFKFSLTDTYGSIFESAHSNNSYHTTFRNPSTIYGIFKKGETLTFKANFSEDLESYELYKCNINDETFSLDVKS